jgi:hypothetical protein
MSHGQTRLAAVPVRFEFAVGCETRRSPDPWALGVSVEAVDRPTRAISSPVEVDP